MVRRLLLILLLTAVSGIAQAETLTASVDRDELMDNEHLMLTLSLINSDTRLRAEGLNPNVDLTVLNGDFDVGAPQTDHRYTIERGSGRASSNLTVVLFPKRTGTLTIPAFTVGNVASQPIRIIVHAATATTTPEVFVRSGSGKTTLWNREQTRLYLDLYRRIELKSAKLGSNLDTDPLDVELSLLPQSEREETVNGVRYEVTRSAWLLAPQRSGKQQITFPEVWIETADNRRLHLPSSRTTLTVKALPATLPPLVLIGAPKIEQKISQASVSSGDLTTWEITLSAPVHVSELPAALPDLDFPDALHVYRETATRRNADQDPDRRRSSITYRFALVAASAGQYKLPDIAVPYFDTDTGRLARIAVDGPLLQVTAGVNNGVSGPQQPSTPAKAAEPATTAWMVAAIVLALLWLASLFLLWRQHYRGGNPADRGNAENPHHAQPSTDDLKQKLLRAMACRTLEEGKRKWQHLVAVEPVMQRTITTLQQNYYSRSGRSDETAALAHDVSVCIDKLKNPPTEAVADRRWQAGDFIRPDKLTQP